MAPGWAKIQEIAQAEKGAISKLGEVTRVLLIEDDAEITAEVLAALAEAGHAVSHAGDGERGLALAEAGGFDIIVMDRMLPKLDGLSILDSLRKRSLGVPVLLTSALGEVDERVRGLKAGGDDYLGKPFVITELLARVEVLLRRRAASPSTVLRLGPLEIDLLVRTARRGDRTLELLPREFKLLHYLMQHPGQTLTRAMLLENVWNYRFIAETNLVDVHIGKLRRKVDDVGEPTMLLSVRGAGFMLAMPTLGQ